MRTCIVMSMPTSMGILISITIVTIMAITITATRTIMDTSMTSTAVTRMARSRRIWLDQAAGRVE